MATDLNEMLALLDAVSMHWSSRNEKKNEEMQNHAASDVSRAQLPTPLTRPTNKQIGRIIDADSVAIQWMNYGQFSR